MATPPKRSVLQRMRERTDDVDAAVDAMSAGNAPPKIGGAVAPSKPSARSAASAPSAPSVAPLSAKGAYNKNLAAKRAAAKKRS
jgi:hypothetical protein